MSSAPPIVQGPSSSAAPPPNDSPSCRYLGIGIAAMLGLAGVAGVGIAMAHLGIPHHFWSTKLLSYLPKLSIPITMSGGGVAIVVSVVGGFMVYKFARPPVRPSLGPPPAVYSNPPVAPAAALIPEEKLPDFEQGLKSWIDEADGEQKTAREGAASEMRQCFQQGRHYLELAQRNLTSLPSVIGQLKVFFLFLSDNQLTELPKEITQMPLKSLIVSRNQLSEETEARLRTMKGTKGIDISIIGLKDQ